MCHDDIYLNYNNLHRSLLHLTIRNLRSKLLPKLHCSIVQFYRVLEKIVVFITSVVSSLIMEMTSGGDVLFSVRLIRFFLLTCGVHVVAAAAAQNQRRETYMQRMHFKIILLAIFVLIAPQFAYLFKHNDQLYEMLDCLVYILHAIHDSAVAITFYRTRKSFIYILDNMRFDLNNYRELVEPGWKLEMDRKISDALKKIAYISYGSYVAIIVMPIFSVISSDEISNPEQSLIVTAYYPWSMDSRLKFALSYLLQLSVVLIMSSCVPSNCVFLYYFSAEIGAQKKLLLTMVGNIESASWKSARHLRPANEEETSELAVVTYRKGPTGYDEEYQYYPWERIDNDQRKKTWLKEFDDKLCQNIMLCVDFHKRLIR